MYVQKIIVTRFYNVEFIWEVIIFSCLKLISISLICFGDHYEFMGSKQSNITRIPKRVILAKAY